MKSVKQSGRELRRQKPRHTPWIWGTDIRVIPAGDVLAVTGQYPVEESSKVHAADAFLGYLRALPSICPGTDDGRAGKLSPHIQFANAKSDEQLIEFVKQFGPVATTVYVENADGARAAIQELATLRRERDIFLSCLDTIRMLVNGDDDLPRLQHNLKVIESGIEQWPNQWRVERIVRRRNELAPVPGWNFTHETLADIKRRVIEAHLEPHPLAYPEPLECAARIVCTVLDSFPPVLLPGPLGVEERSTSDLDFGIRPQLYFILRREYLNRTAIRICRYQKCNEYFVVEGKRDHQYCSMKCSQRQRSIDNWYKSENGLKKRKKEQAKRRRTKVARKARS